MTQATIRSRCYKTLIFIGLV